MIIAMTAETVESRKHAEGPRSLLHLVGEHESTERKRAHNDVLIVPLYVEELVKLKQVRGTKNPVSEELEQSIEAEGLNTLLETVLVDEEMMAAYIDFVNRTWGGNVMIDDLADKRRTDGTYILVTGGHTRHEIIEKLEAEGKLDHLPINCIVREAKSIWDIVRKQHSSNIQSRSARERSSFANVESYELGILTGEWSDLDDFFEQQKISPKSGMAEDLKRFLELPADIRRYALLDQISYTAAIELSRYANLQRRFVLRKTGVTRPTAEQLASVDELILNELHRVASYAADKQGPSKQEAYIAGERAKLNDTYQALGGRKSDTLPFTMASPDDQLRQMLEEKRKALSLRRRALARARGEKALELLQLSDSAVDKSQIQKDLDDLIQTNTTAAQALQDAIDAAQPADTPDMLFA